VAYAVLRGGLEPIIYQAWVKTWRGKLMGSLGTGVKSREEESEEAWPHHPSSLSNLWNLRKKSESMSRDTWKYFRRISPRKIS
jgi:hypothetical protein